MKSKKQIEWEKKNPRGKAELSWNLNDYLVWGEEPPSCVLEGVTEGQAMEEGNIQAWILESMKSISVIKEEYPLKFNDVYRDFTLDLEYLNEIGKITKKEMLKLAKEDNFLF